MTRVREELAEEGHGNLAGKGEDAILRAPLG